MFQRCGERGTEEGDAHALETRIGFDLKRDKFAERSAERGSACKRLFGRQTNDLRVNTGDLHGLN